MTGLREALAAFAAGVVRAADTSRDDYTLTPPATEHPMTEPTRAQLLHLAARARDGRALPAEHDQLAAGINALYAALTDADEDAAEAREHNERTCEAATRADRAEAAIERVRQLATQWAVLRTYGSAATELRAALDQAQQTTT
ncbi:hypothetical protein OG244_23280 [Streptomyces brevispora]|uniref:hypothetical protein n=1 Tax=Streptomyces brevispora TaxID=887462 RepID=UPI002E37A79A|nr:hypothetical protein [Streptomyces brevispora]